MKFFIYKETLILNIRQKFVKMVYFLKFEVIYMLSTIISIITIIVLIIAIIVKPTIKIKKYEVQTFWIIPLIGTLILLLTGEVGLETIKNIFVSDSSINPIKILVLFIAISLLSIALDEAGFFRKCAILAAKIAGGKQINLFLSFSLVISILTIFTSNDIVILTFTPFICYFAKNTKISPIPYLIAEFIFANTWSMMLIIGNPTNIYIASSFNIDFFGYFKIMLLPTLLAGFTALIVLLLLFKKQLAKEMEVGSDEIECKSNKFVTIVGLIHLSCCTILLAISSYIGLDMWLICLCFAVSLSLILLVYCLIKKEDVLIKSLKRLPYNLIPFILSMFIIVTSLDKVGIIDKIADLFDKITTNSVNTVFTYGVSSFLSCNILNNIPMSVMYEKIITSSSLLFMQEKMYSTIIASNIGAYFTPIGALAGIMWMGILNKTGIKFGFKEFLKYGVIIAPIIICVSLVTLLFIL